MNDPLSAPSGVRVRTNGDQLIVVRRWRSLNHLVALIGGCVFVWIAWRSFNGDVDNARDPIGHAIDGYMKPGFAAILGFAALAHAVTGFVNARWIVISPDALIIHDGPIPVFGNVHIQTSPLRSVRQRNESQRGLRSRTYYFCVDATLQDGRTVEIDRIAENEAQAQYVFEVILRHLRARPPA